MPSLGGSPRSSSLSWLADSRARCALASVTICCRAGTGVAPARRGVGEPRANRESGMRSSDHRPSDLLRVVLQSGGFRPTLPTAARHQVTARSATLLDPVGPWRPVEMVLSTNVASVSAKSTRATSAYHRNWTRTLTPARSIGVARILNFRLTEARQKLNQPSLAPRNRCHQ